MLCPYCSSDIPDAAAHCPYCGEAVAGRGAPPPGSPPSPPAGYPPSAYPPPPPPPGYAPPPPGAFPPPPGVPPVPAKPEGEQGALILGIVSIVMGVLSCCCGIGSIVAIITGAIGMVMANKHATACRAMGVTPSGNANTGKVLSIIGLVLGILGTLGWVLYVILNGVAVAMSPRSFN